MIYATDHSTRHGRFKPPSFESLWDSSDFKDPTYIQFLIRYRMRMRRLSGEEAGHLYFGIGAGAVGVSEHTSSPAGLTPKNAALWVRAWGRHLLNLEVLAARGRSLFAEPTCSGSLAMSD